MMSSMMDAWAAEAAAEVNDEHVSRQLMRTPATSSWLSARFPAHFPDTQPFRALPLDVLLKGGPPVAAAPSSPMPSPLAQRRPIRAASSPLRHTSPANRSPARGVRVPTNNLFHVFGYKELSFLSPLLRPFHSSCALLRWGDTLYLRADFFSFAEPTKDLPIFRWTSIRLN